MKATVDEDAAAKDAAAKDAAAKDAAAKDAAAKTELAGSKRCELKLFCSRARSFRRAELLAGWKFP
jgi:hypothetical protein